MPGTARWAVAGLFCLACGGAGGETAGQPDPSGPAPEGINETPADDYLRYQLDFRDDAVVVDDLAGVQRALVRADYALGEFVFQSDFAGLDGLEVGSAAVLAGVGVFRIVGRESTSEGELVRVEEAPLTDVLENASIAWRKSFVSAYTADRIGLGVDEDERDSIGKERAAASSFLDGKLHYEGKSGKWSTVFDLAPGEGGLDYSVATTFGGTVGSMTAKMNGTLRGMTQEVDLEIIGGVVAQYEELYYDVAGNVNFEVGAAKAQGEAKIGIPARLSLPFAIGPIPFRIDLGSSIAIATTLQADSSAEFAGSVKFAGDAGVRFKDGGLEYIASFDTTDLNLSESKQTSSVTAGVSALLNFPELSVGVGVPKVAEGVAFLRFKSEAITNGTILLDANGETDGICVEAGTNFGASYGGDAKFLGVKVLSAEKDLFGKIGAKRRSSDCEG
jgi:hypothetical protein